MATETSTTTDPHAACRSDKEFFEKQNERLRVDLNTTQKALHDEKQNNLFTVVLLILCCVGAWQLLSLYVFRGMAHGAHARHNAEAQARIYLRQVRYPFAGVYCESAGGTERNHCVAVTLSGDRKEIGCDDDEIVTNDGCVPWVAQR